MVLTLVNMRVVIKFYTYRYVDKNGVNISV